ncbi:MAG: RNA-binding protein [Porticoccaceae bacterium]|nr:RNA-binding protein [Porticoccaceae bacterium]
MKLLVRNLSRATSEAELRALFEAYGAVQSCKLVMDAENGLSKGFAFVSMPKPGEAKAAMKNLNGLEVAGNKIRVKKAEEKGADNSGDKSHVAGIQEN